MSKNPFGQLTIRHDDEDEEIIKSQTVTAQTHTTPQLFSTAGTAQADLKKKKKVRPEEKAKLEELQQDLRRGDEEEETGFQVVQKKATRTNKPSNDEAQTEDNKNRKPKNKGAYLERNDKQDNRPGKRQFERHSGTGRGKEISKGGAGGGHTWGNNPKNIARETAKHSEEPGTGYYERDDDRWFSSALNRDERKHKENQEEQKVEEVEAKEEQPVEEKKEETGATEEQGDYRRKKKFPVTEEVKKEDLLERPENALSVGEYKQLLKQKNQGLTAKQANVVRANETEAQPKTRDESEFIMGAGEIKKKNLKQKEKKANTDVKELVVDIKTEDGERRYHDKENRGDNRKGKGKYHYKDEDFPEL
jgi:hypothetical protein